MTTQSTQQTPSPPPSPTPYPGETFLSTWPNVKFFLSPTEPFLADWASLAAFYGHGHIHLSTCRLVLTLDPPPTPPTKTPHTLSIPLIWLRKDRLHIRRPFFDSNHLAAVLVPVDIACTALGHFFALPGKPLQFRLEMLDGAMNDHLCRALHDLLADPERVARDTKALRRAVDQALVETDVHYAFVDPRDTTFLHLCTQMEYPSGTCEEVDVA